MYDPCGTQRLEGDDIIKRLAKYLGVEPVDLKEALLDAAKYYEARRLLKANKDQ